MQHYHITEVTDGFFIILHKIIFLKILSEHMRYWNLNYSSINFGICLPFFFFFCFLALYLQHMVSKLARGWSGATADGLHHSYSNVGSKLCLCLHHSSRQCQILNALSEVRDQTGILIDTSRAHYCWAMLGTSCLFFLITAMFSSSFLFLFLYICYPVN